MTPPHIVNHLDARYGRWAGTAFLGAIALLIAAASLYSIYVNVVLPVVSLLN